MAELSFKYRLYPNDKQKKRISIINDAVTILYNKMLLERTENYHKTGSWKKLDPTPHIQQNSVLTQLAPSVVNWTLNSLEHAYAYFFKFETSKLDRYTKEALQRVHENPDYKLSDTDLISYPKLKRKQNKENWTIGAADVAIEDKKINVAGIGPIKIKLHRPLPENAEIISYTIMKTLAGEYYVIVRIRLETPQQKVPLNGALGVALMPGKLAVRSDSVPVEFSHYDDELKRQIAREYKTLKRRTPGSKRYEKQRRHLASLYAKRVNQRRDALHKISRDIVNAADAVYMESPEVLRRKKKLVKTGEIDTVLDEAWWRFSSFIEYKANSQGKKFWKVNRGFPAYTICAACGAVVKDSTVKDAFCCPKCGIVMNPAENAASNYAALAEKYIHEWNEYNNC